MLLALAFSVLPTWDRIELVRPAMAQGGDDELPDVASAFGRLKVAEIVRIYYLEPTAATVRRQGTNDAKLMTLVDRLRLTVSNDATFYPGAWAERPAPGEGLQASVDATYVWSKKELFWLASLQALSHPEARSTAEAALAQYGLRCRETQKRGLPAPWLSLTPMAPGRLFGAVDHALASLSPAHRRVVDDLSLRIGRQFMAYVLLHEIAHHYLGHTGMRVATGDAPRLELLADEWALQAAAAMGYSMADVLTVLRFEARAEAERIAAGYRVSPTHPSWSTRSAMAEGLLQRIAVQHPDVVRLVGLMPVHGSAGVRYVNVELRFPRDPGVAGTSISRLVLDDRSEDLEGVVSHRPGGTYLWFREYRSGTRYRIHVDRVSSHEPLITWETIRDGPAGPVHVASFSLRPEYALDPVAALLGRSSLRAEIWRVSEALRRSGVPSDLRVEAADAFFASERALERAVTAWVTGECDEPTFDATRERVQRERWERQRTILGVALYAGFREQYFALLHD